MPGSLNSCPNNPNTQHCVLFSTVSHWTGPQSLYYCFPRSRTLLQIARFILDDPDLSTQLGYGALLGSNRSTELLKQYIYCSAHVPAASSNERYHAASWCIASVGITLILVATVCDYKWRVGTSSVTHEADETGNEGASELNPRATPACSPLISAEEVREDSTKLPTTPSPDCSRQCPRAGGLSRFHQIYGVHSPLLTPEEQLTAQSAVDSSSASIPSAQEASVFSSLTQQRLGFQGTSMRSDEQFLGIKAGVALASVPTLMQESGDGGNSCVTKLHALNVEKLNRSLQKDSLRGSDAPVLRSGVAHVVQCLSLVSSFQKWRGYPESESDLNLFNGLRVITFLWVTIFGTFWFTQQISPVNSSVVPSDSMLYAFLQKRVFSACAISTFLVIAGFLTLHRLHIYEEWQMKSPAVRAKWSRGTRRQWLLKGALSYTRYVVSRFVRVIPVALTVTLLVPNILPATSKGPLWMALSNAPALHKNCEDYWWTNLLLINNMVPTDGSKCCFPWSYYVALEFQLVATGPLIYRLARSLHTRVYTAGSIACVMIGVALRYSAFMSKKGKHLEKSEAAPYTFDAGALYEWPHLMFIPFLAGAILHRIYIAVKHRAQTLLMFGPDMFTVMHRCPESTTTEDRLSYFILEKLRLRSMRFLIMWGGIGMMCLCVFWGWSVLHLSQETTQVSVCRAAYESLILLFWCLGLCMLVFPLLFGYGGATRRFLVHPLWCGLSRLVLVGYLLTPIVIGIVNAHWGPTNVGVMLLLMLRWLGCTFLTFLAAFVLHMLVERPFLYISSQGKY
ncbi:uncharacterized protein TEOVI_000720600 [Trypanosoma equiperdum]|uniref:Transmembrane protein n=1 Tax=Trypanosoma equiperdum TaxID=5694 RepID=A0A1G4I0A0_TRYEQ|nr:hypothetical protein, conserved [Trypanosoma equiperdum]